MISRDANFDFSSTNPFQWCRFKRVGTILNALSLTFPVGEKHFIKAVRAHEHLADDDLLEDIKVFYKQEAKHSREHEKFNRLLESHGVNKTEIENNIRDILSRYSTNSSLLVSTVVLEELTGLGAHLIPHLRQIISGDQNVSELWQWHATEEREHVHVARELLRRAEVSKREIVWHGSKTLIDFARTVRRNLKEIKRAEKS